MQKIKLIDLHSHSFFSDGIATPSELVRYAQIKGYTVFSITDHVDLSNYKQVINSMLELKEVDFSPLIFIPGIEITHTLPSDIKKITDYARNSGIKWIGVHGETVVEPVIKGTNIAAIEAKVNFLAHPGFITEKELKLAAKNKVFIEITLRKGHSLTNGYIYQKGKKAGVDFIINSDAHKPSELFGKELYLSTALGSGMSKDDFLFYNQRLYNYLLENIL